LFTGFQIPTWVSVQDLTQEEKEQHKEELLAIEERKKVSEGQSTLLPPTTSIMNTVHLGIGSQDKAPPRETDCDVLKINYGHSNNHDVSMNVQP
jgi:hypothetical protein